MAASADPGYRFFNQVGSMPYRWDPCVPIHYRITWNGISTREGAVVRAALRMISSATGISFVFSGASRVIPQQGTWPAAKAARTQLLIAFASPGRGRGRSTMLSGSEVGVGGPAGIGVLYTSGAVVIDKRSWTTYHMSAKNRQILYMHELGHAMGLAHTTRRGQIMRSGSYPARAVWGAGDKAGLRKLGRAAGCPTAPGPVSGLKAVRVAGGGARVTWVGGSNGHLPPSYEYLVTQKGSGFETSYGSGQPGTTLVLGADDLALGAGGTTTVSVRARNGKGASAWRTVTVP